MPAVRRDITVGDELALFYRGKYVGRTRVVYIGANHVQCAGPNGALRDFARATGLRRHNESRHEVFPPEHDAVEHLDRLELAGEIILAVTTGLGQRSTLQLRDAILALEPGPRKTTP